MMLSIIKRFTPRNYETLGVYYREVGAHLSAHIFAFNWREHQKHQTYADTEAQGFEENILRYLIFYCTFLTSVS